MRRVTLMLAAIAMMVSLFAVAAYAASIVGTRGGDMLFESQKRDTISGRTGTDTIDARMFPDATHPKPDRDQANGNKGADTIYVNDGDDLDTANGGKGIDTCTGDFGDTLHCEVRLIEAP